MLQKLNLKYINISQFVISILLKLLHRILGLQIDLGGNYYASQVNLATQWTT